MFDKVCLTSIMARSCSNHAPCAMEPPEAARRIAQRLVAGEPVQNVEARLRRKDGSVRSVRISSTARFEDGVLAQIRTVTQDVSDWTERALAMAQFQAMVESAHDAIIGKTLDGIITYWNPAATRLYGYTAEEAIGQSVSLLMPFERPNELPSILERLRLGERVEQFETIRVRKGGDRIHVSVTISPILGDDGTPIGASVFARDATERMIAEERLRLGAQQDALTQLPNRVLFNDRVARALERQRRDLTYRFAVLFLDFDDFKVVNDSLGHAAGDRLLLAIATRLRECVRPEDVVARLGGDEFTLLLENVANASEAEQAAQRIQQCLSAPFDLGDRQVVVSASIGVALGDASYGQAEDMVRDADIAMYRAKGHGHARFQVFDITMRNWAHARFRTTTDLRGALDRKELMLAYQPIVELATGKIRAFEALLRWHHPTRGVIEPSEFIPLAEQTGLIVPIGAWVLSNACAQARRWQQSRPRNAHVGVSVNLSAKQLGHAGIVEEVRGALKSSELDPRALRLEITETVLVGNGATPTTRLEELARLLVELHVDDFGTGYSWLSYLPRFPLNTIKVDRSFVHRMGARRTDVEIVRSIVDLATTLGLGVIAEGVETETQRERLMAFGCELGQGFLFSQPLDADEVDAVLARSGALAAKGRDGSSGW